MTIKRPLDYKTVAARRKTIQIASFVAILLGLVSLAAGIYLLLLSRSFPAQASSNLFSLVLGIVLILFGLWRFVLSARYLLFLKHHPLTPPTSSQERHDT